MRIEKWDKDKIWTAVLYDADNNGFPYVKRFLMEATRRPQNFLGENKDSKLILLTDKPHPLLHITYGGADAFRGTEDIDAEQFIAVKGFKAKGKRLTTWAIDKVEENSPEPTEEEALNEEAPLDGADSTVETSPEGTQSTAEDNQQEEENLDPDKGKSQQEVADEITGQTNFFDKLDE